MTWNGDDPSRQEAPSDDRPETLSSPHVAPGVDVPAPVHPVQGGYAAPYGYAGSAAGFPAPGSQAPSYQGPGAAAPGYPAAGYPAPGPSQYAPYPLGYAQPPYGYAPPQKPRLLPAAVPVPDRAYSEALQPAERRVGRWFLAWLIAAGFFGLGQVAAVALLLPGMIEAFANIPLPEPGAPVTGDTEAASEALSEVVTSPLGLLGVNLGWAAMIPGAIVATAAFGKGAAGLVASVVGRWRWSVVGRSALTIVPIFAVYIGISLASDGSIEWKWDPNWVLVAVVLLSTPLQSTGEEFAFRGFLTQQLGGWVRQRWVPVIVMAIFGMMSLFAGGMQGGPTAAVMTAVALSILAAGVGPWVSRGALTNALWTGASTGLLFGSMHGHESFAATLQLSLVGFACSMLTYRTGGLEAASVLHVANNVFIMLPLALTGTSALSSQPVTGEDLGALALTTAALGAAYAAVHFTVSRAERRTVGAPGAELIEPSARPVVNSYVPA